MSNKTYSVRSLEAKKGKMRNFNYEVHMCIPNLMTHSIFSNQAWNDTLLCARGHAQPPTFIWAKQAIIKISHPICHRVFFSINVTKLIGKMIWSRDNGKLLLMSAESQSCETRRDETRREKKRGREWEEMISFHWVIVYWKDHSTFP